MKEQYHKSTLRAKGQVTLPGPIRERLGIKEGDDLAFYITGDGRVVVEALQVIPPDQRWFWTERWQQMEREAQVDIDFGNEMHFDNMDGALKTLEAEE